VEEARDQTSQGPTSAPMPSSPTQGLAPTPVRLVSDIPVVYADGITNHVIGPGISKFYLHRSDATPRNPNEYNQVTVVQIIMPSTGLVDMVAFLEHRLRSMVKNEQITQEYIDERRAFYMNYPVP
jgi:hypothetical protein